MKKIFCILVLVLALIFSTSCTEEATKKLSIIMPSGTPALSLAEFVSSKDSSEINYEIVSGSDALVTAFASSSHDIILAPINLGAKMYKTYGTYVLYKTIVWGNLYIASKNEINSLADLDGKTIICFSKNSTPDIVLQALLNNNPNINVTIEYASDVSEANTYLVSGKAEYIVSAEPSLSKLKDKLNLHILDLQTEWEKMTGDASYPQAGIFVKKTIAKSTYMKNILAEIAESIEYTNANPEDAATKAVSMHTSFATLGVDTLTKAIPYCHYEIKDSDKTAVLYYLQTMKDLGFGKQMGEELPDDEFFL